MAADEQCSAAENLFDDVECLLHPLVRPPVGMASNNSGTLARIRQYKISNTRIFSGGILPGQLQIQQ